MKMCHVVMGKHADSQHRGHEFESYKHHNKSTIGEGGNWKPPHTIPFPR